MKSSFPVLSTLLSLSVIALPLGTPSLAFASNASGLGDLVGIRGSSLDNALEARGFIFAKNNAAASMYWNDSSKRCVSALVDDGRLASIESASASDCGKAGGDSGDAALAGLAAVAAVGLIAALASHHDSSGNRKNSSGYNAEYQRGYHDGFGDGRYDTQDSEAYHSGYMAGEAEKNNRRHASSGVVRGAPVTAQDACKKRGDQYWHVPKGSVVPVSAFDYGQGQFEVVVATGHRRANCSVDSHGRVKDFQPQR